MMKEIMKPMTSAPARLPAMRMILIQFRLRRSAGEFASEALARALSDQGGLGIANQIVQELSHSGTNQQVTGNPHGDTVMKILK